MRILTIDVIGIPSGQSGNLVGANVFQDYDALVINPEDFETLYRSVEYRDSDKNILDMDCGRALVALNHRRRNEAKGLLRRGGVIVCFLQPLQTYTYTYVSRGTPGKTTLTNYDWLMDANDRKIQLGIIRYSTGESIELVDSNHPMAEYLKTKPSWSAYIEKDDCPDWKILAMAFDTNVLSLAKRVDLGHIVFLPSYYHYENGEVLEKCIARLLKNKDFSHQPPWARKIIVPGQTELMGKIGKLNLQISTLENERDIAVAQERELDRWKYLLYEKGKHHLEPVVREVFSLIGCSVTPQADKDSDGIVSCEEDVALLEATGSKGSIKMEKLGELNTNMGNYISRKGSKVKGILVGNPFCEEALDNRPPKDSQKPLFAKELVESAEQQGITILLTTDLYKVVTQVINASIKPAELSQMLRAIFKGRGLVRLPNQ